ncbi:MAG TPA: hypothetical protein VII06_31955 [Chloroflexota bacterium]|jgi:hypothetical protein
MRADPGPVEQQIAALFPTEEASLVRAALAAYEPGASAAGRERVQLAVLLLCGGELAEVRRLVADANRDYRDVLAWAEEARGAVDPLGARLAAAVRTPALTPRRLELVCEAVPGLARVAVLLHPRYPGHDAQVAALDVTLLPMEVSRPEQFPDAFATMQRAGATGLVVLSAAFFELRRRQVAALARAAGLAAIGELRPFAVAGGLLSYGPLASQLGARTMAHLRQALGADPPAEPAAPALECMVNLQTARALGLTIPASVLRQATEILR